MNNPFFISFAPGTSGRFMAAILYHMITGSNDDISWDSDNSAHSYDPLILQSHDWSLIPERYKNKPYFINFPSIYQYFRFHNISPKILYNHAYPDFNEIKKNFDDPKIIIITFSEHNLKEIYLNNFRKNKNQIETILFAARHKKFSSEQIVPSDIANNVLCISYDDLFVPEGNSYKVLIELERFIGIKASQSVINGYGLYVENRNKMIQEIT